MTEQIRRTRPSAPPEEHPHGLDRPAPAPGEAQPSAEPMAERHPDASPTWRNSPHSGWRRADALRPGDELCTMTGPATVTGLAFTSERQRVHNLTIQGLATYHVRADGVVVHNVSRDSCRRDNWRSK